MSRKLEILHYKQKGLQEKAEDNPKKAGSHIEETSVVMFKWKEMTSRVPL